MPRDLPLGNGDLLVTFDSRYQLRDIYYPQVGLENHTGGEPCRFGIWADGKFAWTGDDGWERDLRFAHETLVSEVTLGNAALGLRVRCRDAVDFDRTLYLKEVTIEDVTGREGTWRDAEDGELSRNLVAQGSIDSVGMLGLRVGANALATATFVIAAGQTYDEVRDLDKLVRERGVGSFLSRTGDYWNLWAN